MIRAAFSARCCAGYPTMMTSCSPAVFGRSALEQVPVTDTIGTAHVRYSRAAVALAVSRGSTAT